MCHMMAYASDFEMAENSNNSDFGSKYQSRVQNPEMAHFFYSENPETTQNSNHVRLEYDFFSNFWPFRGFRTKKVGHLRVLTLDLYFEPISELFEFWAISKSDAYWALHHKDPP